MITKVKLTGICSTYTVHMTYTTNTTRITAASITSGAVRNQITTTEAFFWHGKGFNVVEYVFWEFWEHLLY